MKPVIFAAGDGTYCKKYGDTVRNSAKAHGLDCIVSCNGLTVGQGCTREEANAFRWRLLPDILRMRPRVLMLDLDTVIRKPIEIKPWWDWGVVLRDDTTNENKRVNGGCFY